MVKLKKNVIFFTSGGIGYGAIELLWRGRTHWTMIIAGGLCFIIFSVVADKMRNKRRIYKAAVCSMGVTAVEFIFGVIFNIILKMNVWDYSSVPFNFMGQICLLFSLIWGVLAFALLPLAEVLNKKLAV